MSDFPAVFANEAVATIEGLTGQAPSITLKGQKISLSSPMSYLRLFKFM